MSKINDQINEKEENQDDLQILLLDKIIHQLMNEFNDNEDVGAYVLALSTLFIRNMADIINECMQKEKEECINIICNKLSIESRKIAIYAMFSAETCTEMRLHEIFKEYMESLIHDFDNCVGVFLEKMDKQKEEQ